MATIGRNGRHLRLLTKRSKNKPRKHQRHTDQDALPLSMQSDSPAGAVLDGPWKAKGARFARSVLRGAAASHSPRRAAGSGYLVASPAPRRTSPIAAATSCAQIPAIAFRPRRK
jgi:hypothetical protein